MRFSGRYFLLFIISILIAFIVYQCEQQKPTINSCCDDDAMPLALIDTAQARAKIDLYLDNQYEYSTNGLNTDYDLPVATDSIFDNREVWFDLDNLKEYICYVEQKSDSLGYDHLGLRVYFGAKIESDGIPRSTAFFWPTHRFEPEMMNIDPDIEDEDTDETINTDSEDNENSYGIKGMNYGGSGKPPKTFDSGN